MSEPFIGQIELFGFTFPPRGWAFCQGQLQAISQNQALFSLLGTNYGGDGRTTFALPDLRGRIPIGQGQGSGLSGYTIGQVGGAEQVTLAPAQMPAHTHSLMVDAATAGSSNNNVPASNEVLGQSAGKTHDGVKLDISLYNTAAPNAALDLRSVSTVGGQPHENRMPYLALNFCIALQGIFPSRN